MTEVFTHRLLSPVWLALLLILVALFALFALGEYETDDLYPDAKGEKYCTDPDIFRR